MDDLVNARAASFEALARREKPGERHVRFLAPLAFLSPRIIAAIADGHAPADLTVTALARALPHSWADQERRFVSAQPIPFCSADVDCAKRLSD